MSEPVRTQPECDSASDEILQLLQNVLDELSEESIPITRDMRIDRYFNEVCGADSLEYLELSFAAEARFGIQLSNEDWKFLAGHEFCASAEEWEAKYAHMFTFGRLAALIAGRVDLGSLEPVTIFGATSLAAGAFRRLQGLARRVDRNVEDFAPSTKLLDRFQGSKLRKFWALLRAVSGNRVPPLAASTASRIANYMWSTPGVVFSLIVGAAATFWLIRGTFGVGMGGSRLAWIFTWLVMSLGMSIVPAILLLIATGVLKLFGHQIGPQRSMLPHGIETFRDVSLLVAGDRGGWCQQCDYDLTGLDGRRCPECGTPQREIRIPSTNRPADKQQPPVPARAHTK